jgi:alkylhydroperoxidase family enzyme
MDEVPTLTVKEKAALRYVECMCRTPVAFTAEAVQDLRAYFTSRGFVILASTCAQVNFWTRLIQSLGVPPAGFSAECGVLNLDAYRTLRPNTSAGAELR